MRMFPASSAATRGPTHTTILRLKEAAGFAIVGEDLLVLGDVLGGATARPKR